MSNITLPARVSTARVYTAMTNGTRSTAIPIQSSDGSSQQEAPSEKAGLVQAVPTPAVNTTSSVSSISSATSSNTVEIASSAATSLPSPSPSSSSSSSTSPTTSPTTPSSSSSLSSLPLSLSSSLPSSSSPTSQTPSSGLVSISGVSALSSPAVSLPPAALITAAQPQPQTSSTGQPSTAESSSLAASSSIALQPTDAIIAHQASSATPSDAISVEPTPSEVAAAAAAAAAVTSAEAAAGPEEAQTNQAAAPSTDPAASATLAASAESQTTAAAASAGSPSATATPSAQGQESISTPPGSSSLFLTSSLAPNDVPVPTSTALGSTAIVSQDPSGPQIAKQTAAPSTSPLGTTSGLAQNEGGTVSTAAIAGGVMGGVALVGLLVLALWLIRRRRRSRKDGFLSPLTPGMAPGTGATGSGNDGTREKYVIDRDSVGPTPRAEKIKQTIRYGFGRIVSGRFPGLKALRNSDSRSQSPAVDMDRGTSQFLDPGPLAAGSAGGRSRPSSSAFSTSSSRGGRVTTAKERLFVWWSRLVDDIQIQLRGSRSSRQESDPLRDPFAGTQSMRQQEQQRRGPQGTGSDGFLRALNLDGDDNPFSDSQALSHSSAAPPPLMVSSRAGPGVLATNPFSDANAVAEPPAAAVRYPFLNNAPPGYGTTNDAARRSRGLSLGGGGMRPPSTSSYRGRESMVSSLYRSSTSSPRGSVESLSGESLRGGWRRSRFRSDPFDLEQLGGSIGDSIGSGIGVVRTVQQQQEWRQSMRASGAHARASSLGATSSKYSSGLTMSECSDPGPDVGTGQPAYGHQGVGEAL